MFPHGRVDISYGVLMNLGELVWIKSELDVFKSTSSLLQEAVTSDFDICVMMDSKQVREALLNSDKFSWISRFQARALARMARNPQGIS